MQDVEKFLSAAFTPTLRVLPVWSSGADLQPRSCRRRKDMQSGSQQTRRCSVCKAAMRKISVTLPRAHNAVFNRNTRRPAHVKIWKSKYTSEWKSNTGNDSLLPKSKNIWGSRRRGFLQKLTTEDRSQTVNFQRTGSQKCSWKLNCLCLNGAKRRRLGRPRRSSDQWVSEDLLGVYLSPTRPVPPPILRKMSLFLIPRPPDTTVAFWVIQRGTNQGQVAHQSGEKSSCRPESEVLVGMRSKKIKRRFLKSRKSELKVVKDSKGSCSLVLFHSSEDLRGRRLSK